MERDPLVEAEPEDGVKLKGKQKCIQTNSLFVYRASTLAGAKEPIRIRLLSFTNALRERPTNDLSPSPRRCHLAGEANQIVDFPRPFHPSLALAPFFNPFTAEGWHFWWVWQLAREVGRWGARWAAAFRASSDNLAGRGVAVSAKCPAEDLTGGC